MGYRSQVRALIYGPKDHLDAYIVQVRLIENKNRVFKDFSESLTRYAAKVAVFSETTGTLVEQEVHVLDLYGDNWKWYENYEDVQAWEAFMREAENNELNYEFVRIGEEANDIVIECSTQAAGFISVNSVITEGIDKQGENIPISF